MEGANMAGLRTIRRKASIKDLRSAAVMWENVYTGPGLSAAGKERDHSTTLCHPMSPSQATVIAGPSGSLVRSYTTTTTGFSAHTLPSTNMDPILPLNIIKRKKPGIPPPRRRRRSRLAPTPVQQAPLQVVQEESEPTDSSSSTYSFNLFRSTPSPRSSVDSKGSVRTNETSPALSLKELPPDDTTTTNDDTQTTLPKMPCGTSFLHMGPSTPLSMSPIPPSSPPKPSRPPRNPLRQQRKPVPTAPLPPTPSNYQQQHPLQSHPLLPPLKVAPCPLPTIIIQTPPLRILRPHQSEPQLSTPDRSRPATAPHNYTKFPSSSEQYDRSRNTSTSSLGSTKTTSNVALTPFEKQPAARPGAAALSSSRGCTNDPQDPPIFVYAFLSDSIILSLLFARDLQKDVPKKAARLVSGYELSVLEGGRSNYPLLAPASPSSPTSPIEGYLISNLSPTDRRKLQDFPFHPHWRRSSSPQTPTPLFDMIDVDVDDGKGNTIKATTIAWRKDVSTVTGLKLVPRAWDMEKGRKACVAAYLSVYCSPEKSAERLKLKKRAQRKITHVKDDFVPALRNVRSIV